MHLGTRLLKHYVHIHLCIQSVHTHTGLVLFGLYEAGALLVGMDVEFTVSAALLFGTIVAAVDPVAVSTWTSGLTFDPSYP